MAMSLSRIKVRGVKLSLLFLGLCLGTLAAQDSLTVDELVSFVKSSIQLKQSDKKVADYLRKVTLSQKLEDRTIELLQAEGAGPKTLEALRDLRDASGKLTPPPPVEAKPEPKQDPPPSPEEQKRIIEEVRDYALNYAKHLPDFICTQVTRRYLDRDHSGIWGLQDTIAAKLTYFEQKERYSNITINGRMTDQQYEALGGASSRGEFGSMLRDLFEPETEASFNWDHWGGLHGGRIMYVFRYFVEQSRSRWHLVSEHTQDIVTAYSGLVYVNFDTHVVERITLKAEQIPSSFSLQDVSDVLDYDLAKIADREFMLPLRAEVRMRSDQGLTKNDVEFRLYQKFSADIKILPDVPTEAPAPLPDSETKEQPAPKPQPTDEKTLKPQNQ
jgi:hypothetical protein